MSARMSNASREAYPMCGRQMQLGAFSKGWSRGSGGSCSYTSMAAPAIVPAVNASASAGMSTTFPRAVLTRMALAFIMARRSRLMRWVIKTKEQIIIISIGNKLLRKLFSFPFSKSNFLAIMKLDRYDWRDFYDPIYIFRTWCIILRCVFV